MNPHSVLENSTVGVVSRANISFVPSVPVAERIIHRILELGIPPMLGNSRTRTLTESHIDLPVQMNLGLSETDGRAKLAELAQLTDSSELLVVSFGVVVLHRSIVIDERPAELAELFLGDLEFLGDHLASPISALPYALRLTQYSAAHVAKQTLIIGPGRGR